MANPSSNMANCSSSNASSTGHSALLKVVTAGRPRQVRLLLDSSTNPTTVDVTDDCGQTPLIRALFLEHARNRERIVRMLLKHGARVGLSDVAGRSALSWACLYGRDKELGWLLQHAGVGVNQSNSEEIVNQADHGGQTPLFHAVTAGNAACVKLMCDAIQQCGHSLETSTTNGVSPLMQALKQGHDVCASILIRQGGASLSPDILETYKQFSTRTKGQWAQKCLKKKLSGSSSGSGDTTGELLPPIIPASCIPKIQYRENRARQASFVTPSSSRHKIPKTRRQQSDDEYDGDHLNDDDDDEADSMYDSSGVGMSSNGSSSSGSAYTGGRLTTMSFISTSSTEVNADSEEEEEYDEDDDAQTVYRVYNPGSQPQNDDANTNTNAQHGQASVHASSAASSHRPKAAKQKSRVHRTATRGSEGQSNNDTGSSGPTDSGSDESDSGEEESDDESGTYTPNSQKDSPAAFPDPQDLTKLLRRKQVPNSQQLHDPSTPRCPSGMMTPRAPSGMTTPRAPSGMTTPRAPSGMATPRGLVGGAASSTLRLDASFSSVSSGETERGEHRCPTSSSSRGVFTSPRLPRLDSRTSLVQLCESTGGPF